MASKPAVKTYSRSHARETVATRAFDEAFSAKQNAAAVPIKAAPTKWGKTSFCRVRDDDPFQTTYKKVKIENETMDPFTFDYDDESGQIKSEPVITPSAPSTSTTSNNGNTNSSTSTSSTNQAGMTFGGLGRPAIPHMKVQKTPVEPTVVIENEENETVVESQPSFRRPIRTYSRASKKDQSQVPDQQVSLSEPMEAEVSVHSEPATQESDVFSSQERPSRVNEDIFGDDDDDEPPPVLRKETTRTYGGRTRGRGAGKAVKVPSQRTSSKTHLLQSLDDENAKTTVLNFRSHFMDPAVYSQFEYTPSGEDPIGRLHNSKVLQKSEVKHGKGSTLIVVCSPKPVPEGKLKQSPVIGAREKEASVRASELIKSTKETVEFSENEFSEFDSPIRYKGEKREKHPFVEPSSKRTKLDTTTKQQAVVKQVKNDNIIQKPVSNKTPSETETKRVTRNSSNTQPRKNKIFRSRNKELATEEESTKESQEPQSEEKTPVVNETKTEKVEQVSKDTADSTKENTSKKSNNNNADLSENSFGFEDGSSQDDSQKSGKEDENSETPTSSQDTNVDNSSQEGGGGTDVEMLESSQESLPNSQSSSEGQSSSQEITSKKKASQSLILSKESKDRKIFKSRNKNSDVQRKIFQSPKKSPSKAVYNVRSWQADFDEEDRSGSSGDESQPPKLQPITKQVPQFEEDDKQAEPPRLVRAMHWPKQDDAYTSVHVTKQHKELYTVVKNVKEAHECQEYGETQEYIDDVEYLLDGLQDKQPMSTRCLSCIGIAQKCIIPAFRMHLRAHGIITKIFGSVQDACSDPSLALCTSLVMFMLSRDRLNMDLDDQSVTLMLSLLGVDNQEISASMTAAGKRALNRNKDRVKEVYEQLQKELQKEGKPKLPELEFVSTGNLAMESLLSLTSKSAGEWFKEELRKHGALDHIVDTVCSCIEVVSDDTTLLTDSTIENIKKVDRCLRVLENVTFTNEENQQYLISYKQSGLIKSVCSALYTCEQCLPIYPLADLEKVDKESTGYVIYSCILAILRMLLNITHGNEFACQKVGEQNVFIDTTLVCILQTPQYVPLDFRFDVLVLSLGLLINLVEHCEVNRRRLIEAYATPSYELNTSNTVSIPAIKALVQLFCHRFEVANKMEEQDFKEPSTPSHSPDKSGEWRESDSGIEWVVDSAKKDGSTVEEPPKNSRNSNDLKNSNPNNLDDEETFTKALHRAGKHMENSIVASYVGLLLGCLIQDNSDFVEKVKKQLPSGNFEDMIAVLKKFLAFMNFTSVIGSGGTGGKSIAHVIEVLEAC